MGVETNNSINKKNAPFVIAGALLLVVILSVAVYWHRKELAEINARGLEATATITHFSASAYSTGRKSKGRRREPRYDDDCLKGGSGTSSYMEIGGVKLSLGGKQISCSMNIHFRFTDHTGASHDLTWNYSGGRGEGIRYRVGQTFTIKYLPERPARYKVVKQPESA